MASRFGDQEASAPGVSRFGDAAVGTATLAPPPIAAPPNAITGANAFSAPVDSLTGQSRLAEEHPFLTGLWKGLGTPVPAEMSVGFTPEIAPVIASGVRGAVKAGTENIPALVKSYNPFSGHFNPMETFHYLRTIGQGASQGIENRGMLNEALEAGQRMRQIVGQPGAAPIPPVTAPTGAPDVVPAMVPQRPLWESMTTSPQPAPNPRVPLHAEIPASNPVAPPAIEPIQGRLPSGRVPGGIQNQVAPVTNTGEVVKSVQPITGDINTQEFTGNGSPVPPNAQTFKHAADYTDLNRQFHATWPKGTSLRNIASDVFGTEKGTMPTYEQALKIHEFMLRNGGKIPTAKDFK